jgi:hypothetical protein
MRAAAIAGQIVSTFVCQRTEGPAKAMDSGLHDAKCLDIGGARRDSRPFHSSANRNLSGSHYQEKHMNRIESPFKPLLWLMALLLSAFVAACGGGGGGGSSTTSVPPAPANVIPGAAGSPGAAATNPTVLAASPGSGATSVPTSTKSKTNVVSVKVLTATFNEAMNPATLNSAPAGTLLTFTLRNNTLGVDVPGTVAMSGGNTIATFTPTAVALNAASSYTATITTAAKTAGGTAMPNPVAWSFTTTAVLTTGQAPVDLLSVLTNNFVILTGTGITNTGSHLTVITGNIGASGITAAAMDGVFCTEITGKIYGEDAAYTGSGATGCFAGNPGVPAVVPPDANKTLVNNALADMITAFGDAKGRTGPDFVDLHAGVLGGKTLVPGLYKYNAGVGIATDVTLSGGADDVWIFQIAGDITQGPGAKVLLSGGAKAKNIFWQVDGGTGVALNTTAVMQGTILALKAITMNTGSKITGRLLAQTAVTLDATTVTAP